MRLKYELEIVELDNEYVAVPVGDNASDFSGIIKVNKAAVEILGLLKQETSEDELIDSLCIKYENDRNEIADMVKDAISFLKSKKLISE